jgi:hypothetical protein
MAGISIIWIAKVNAQAICPPIGTPLPDPPQVVSPFELRAINDPATGKGAFVFEGHEVPPVVRAVPGGTIQLEYINQMSTHSREACVDGPCMNMTNLHFHGLHVSPDAPADDVLAMPGQSLHYTLMRSESVQQVLPSVERDSKLSNLAHDFPRVVGDNLKQEREIDS